MLNELKPDAIIASTPAVVRLCRTHAPNIDIHLSTQANVLNYLDAQIYQDLGVKRIIAARECSLKDLQDIKKHCPDLELEIFVHGSMCFAFSGRCLISSLQTGRVSNKGSCANDCRFEYDIYAKAKNSDEMLQISQDKRSTHIFNAKDLNMIEHLPKLLSSGVIDSLKIEGRTKSVYYLATATKAYRDAINDYFSSNFKSEKYAQELDTIKHRGYTDGYIIKRPYQKHDTQNHETAISDGTMDVLALVQEDGLSFLAKGTLRPNEAYEILSYERVQETNTELGRVFSQDNKQFVEFNRIETTSGKIMASVHSGNLNCVKLPSYFPPFSILRTQVE